MVRGRYHLAGASSAAFADGFNLLVNIGTASIDSWVAAAARSEADVIRLDASPAGSDSGAWQEVALSVRQLQRAERLAETESLDLMEAPPGPGPSSIYGRLRRRGPVHFLARHNFWIVLGYDAVRAALFDSERLSNVVYRDVGPVVMADDPPLHRDRRRLIGDLFGPARIAQHASAIARLSADLPSGEFDLVAGFARPLAQALAFALLEIPEAAQATFAAAAEAYHHEDRDIARYIARLDELSGQSAILGRLLSPGDGELTAAEGRALVRFLWMAATETTERLIVQTALLLLEDAGRRREALSGAEMLRAFIDEVLRLHPPELMIPRRTAAPMTISGVTIPAGEHVMLCLAAANRDPSRFAAPNMLRLDRTPGRHLSFGSGIHKCAGTALAGPIAEVAIRGLFDTAPGLEAAEPLGGLPHYRSLTVATPSRLLVRR
jgi:cytochrome P450